VFPEGLQYLFAIEDYGKIGRELRKEESGDYNFF
jgi:hypothetical protein